MNITLNLVDYLAVSPLLIVLMGALILLLLESFSTGLTKKIGSYLTLAILALAIFAVIKAPASSNPLLTPWLVFDTLTHDFNLLFLGTGFGVTLLSAPFFEKFDPTRGEYYFLLLAAIFGLMLIGMAADFLILFLGIETLSISLYVMCGYMKKWESSHESSAKYFLMGSLAASFLLYGIALIYGATGSTRLDILLPTFQSLTDTSMQTLFYTGLAFVTLGLAFEAAAWPVHFWAPDVYDGAPTPVTAFMAVGTKIGAFAAFVRVFFGALPEFEPLFHEELAWIAYPTLIYGTFVALRQIKMRRFFAYSGIANAGFLLIPLAVGTQDALAPLLFYLVVYSLATLGSFAVLAILEQNSSGVTLSDLKGLFQRSPFLASVFSLCLLTLAGLPPTAGFFAKFYIFKVALQGHFYTLTAVALLTTIISIFYYLRIIAVMYSDAEKEASVPKTSWKAPALGLLTAALVIYLSFYPTPLIEHFQRMIP